MKKLLSWTLKTRLAPFSLHLLPWSGPSWPGSEEDFTNSWVIDSKSGIDNISEEKSGKEGKPFKKELKTLMFQVNICQGNSPG